MQDALEQALSEGGKVFGGKRQLEDQFPNAYYVSPAIVEMPEQSDVVRHETFAPILYVVGYKDFAQALQLNNRSEEHTSELQSLMRTSYDVFSLKKKNTSH